MSTERDDSRAGVEPRGDIAGIILKARQALALNQSELGAKAGVSRSRISAAEAGTSLPTMEVCLKLARALELPLAVMVRAHVRDAVREVDSSAVRELETELWGGGSHWSTIAQHHGLQIGMGRITGLVDEQGNLRLIRRYEDCRATRPRERVVFRDRVVGERPPSFAVKGSPRGLGYNMNVSIEGEWALHRVEFHTPWRAEDGSFDFEFETYIPGAFVLDTDDYNRRRKADGLSERRDWRGDFRFAVTYAYEQVKLAIEFPASYRPVWQEPTATWGTAPLEDSDYFRIHEKICKGCTVAGDQNKSELSLDRPVPGYTYGMQWTPVAWEPGDEDE